jgi:two-component system, chemotaxis family, chemotaxis protein CheY
MKRVLVIEDDTALCWLLERILKVKYEVVCVSNGLDAASWLSEGKPCDLIVSDLMMPALNGFELLETLRDSGLYNTIPVIILSGFTDSKEECLQLGAVGYLIKPFTPQQLLQEVEAALESKSKINLNKRQPITK